MAFIQTFTRLESSTFRRLCGVQLFSALFGDRGWRCEFGVELKRGRVRGRPRPRFGVCGIELQSPLVWQEDISLRQWGDNVVHVWSPVETSEGVWGFWVFLECRQRVPFLFGELKCCSGHEFCTELSGPSAQALLAATSFSLGWMHFFFLPLWDLFEVFDGHLGVVIFWGTVDSGLRDFEDATPFKPISSWVEFCKQADESGSALWSAAWGFSFFFLVVLCPHDSAVFRSCDTVVSLLRKMEALSVETGLLRSAKTSQMVRQVLWGFLRWREDKLSDELIPATTDVSAHCNQPMVGYILLGCKESQSEVYYSC